MHYHSEFPNFVESMSVPSYSQMELDSRLQQLISEENMTQSYSGIGGLSTETLDSRTPQPSSRTSPCRTFSSSGTSSPSDQPCRMPSSKTYIPRMSPYYKIPLNSDKGLSNKRLSQSSTGLFSMPCASTLYFGDVGSFDVSYDFLLLYFHFSRVAGS